MKSYDLLNSLKQIEVDDKYYEQAKNFEASFNKMKKDDFVIETALVAEETFEKMFELRNVPDDFFDAYKDSFTNSEINLFQHFKDILNNDNIRSSKGFISTLKGKIFELRAMDQLNIENPDMDFLLADSANQPIWDIKGIDLDRAVEFFQAKVRQPSYLSRLVEKIESNPDVKFLLSEELYEKAIAKFPELQENLKLINITNSELTQEVSEKLDVLIGNWGIDLPDELGDWLPWIGEIVLGLKLLVQLVNNNRIYEFSNQDLKSKTAILKTISLLSKFGIKSAFLWLGTYAGAPYIPPFGAIVGGTSGVILGRSISKMIDPHLQQIVKLLLNIDEDAMFYFSNKFNVDTIGYNMLNIDFENK
ncbi:MAG: hypothetical protein RAO94_07305 [Candidatus Stygibacter australis]|nr:hypothetical protein [Candidatus Stygibacter australis]MDP8322139.1 hypothetical protein [Candidatus Stygibacter australis]